MKNKGAFEYRRISMEGNHPRLPVLLYHDIHLNGEWAPFSIQYAKLSLQFSHLKNNGFNAITVGQLDDYINAGKALPEKPVLITFDDGYKSIMTFLYPLLQLHDLKATAFINPSFITEHGDEENTYLTMQDLTTINGDYIEWAIHSYEHTNYKTFTPIQVAHDIRICKNWFQVHKIPVIQALAFPFGAYPKYNLFKRERFFLTLYLSGIKLSFRIGNRLNILGKRRRTLIQRIDIDGEESIQLFDSYLKKGKRTFLNTLSRTGLIKKQ